MKTSPQATPPRVPVSRSEPVCPYPITFVEADTSSFKHVVQMLTGSSRPGLDNNQTRPSRVSHTKEKTYKLYERRNSFKNFKIKPLFPGASSDHVGYSGLTRKSGTSKNLSPSMLDFTSLVFSPVTPLISRPFMENARKELFLHPSPSNTPTSSEPRLLPLFPVTSTALDSNSS